MPSVTAMKKYKKNGLIPKLSGLLKQQFPDQPGPNKTWLRKQAADPAAQRRLLTQFKQITDLIPHARVRVSFLRAYLRIYANKISKDGRHGSVVMEITKRCNQRCRHCYSRAQRNKSMQTRIINKIVALVRSHYKHVFISGGEPTLDKRVLRIARANPDIMFFMFTNGAGINQEYARKLSLVGNLIPVLSVDGSSQAQHDYFKGRGSWRRIMRAIKALNAARMSWGYLSMVTNINAEEVLSKKFVGFMKQKGAILARYLEYIPVGRQAKPELVPSAATYYLMEKRKLEIIRNHEIYMQETAQRKCSGLIFFDVDANIKCCPFFHYAKYNLSQSGVNPERLVEKSAADWRRVPYSGECPIYSDQEGFKACLSRFKWRPTVSWSRENSITPELSRVMSDNYRSFLKMKADKGL